MKTRQEILAEDYARQMEKRAEAKLLECEAAVEEYLATVAEEEASQQPAKELELVHADTFQVSQEHNQIIEDAINRVPADLFATEEEVAATIATDPEGYDRRQREVSEKHAAESKAERETQEAKQRLQKKRNPFDNSYCGRRAQAAYDNYVKAHYDFENGLISVEARDDALTQSNLATEAFYKDQKERTIWPEWLTLPVIIFIIIPIILLILGVQAGPYEYYH